MTWQDNLLTDRNRINDFLKKAKTVAVLGIKPESHSGQPAYYVAAALSRAGLDVIPVPVYFPEVKEILGKPVFRKLADIGRPVDIVNVFRRPVDVPPHLDDILAAKPKMVWMQSGIRHAEVAQKLAEAGILVVQDRCLMVEYGNW